MCGRYAIALPPEAIRQLFMTHGDVPNWPPYYNAAPTTALPVVRQAKEGGGTATMVMRTQISSQPSWHPTVPRHWN